MFRHLLRISLLCTSFAAAANGPVLDQLRAIDAALAVDDIRPLLAQLDAPASTPEVARLAGRIFARRGEFAEAIEYLRRSLRPDESEKDLLGLETQIWIGFSLQESDQIDQASAVLTAAVADARARQNKPLLALALMGFAALQARMGFLEEAAGVLAEAEPMIADAGPDARLRYYLNSALNQLARGAPEQSITTSAQGLALSTTLAAPQYQIFFDLTNAAAQLRLGRQAQAMAMATRGYEAAKALDLPYYLAPAGQVYGSALTQSGALTEAKSVLIAAERSAIAAQSLLGQSNALRGLIALYDRQPEQSAEQIAALKRAIQVQDQRFAASFTASLAKARADFQVDRAISFGEQAMQSQRATALELQSARYGSYFAAALVASLALAVVVIVQRNRTREALAKTAHAENSQRSTWLVRIAHELRNPAQALVSVLDRIDDGRPPDRGDLHGLQMAARQINTLITDLLDLARAQISPLKLHDETVELRQLIADIERLFAPMAEHKQLQLHCTAASSLPRWVRTDPVRLTQILSNLLSNAVNYTEQGSVSLHAKTIAGELQFVVSDTGAGMDAEELQRIFQPYYSGMAGRRDQRSVGIGMAIVKYLIDAMGGSIHVESMTLRGTQVTIGFPLQIAEALAAPSVATPIPQLAVLLVDDDDLVRTLLSAQLSVLGIQITEASTIAAAKAACAKQAPDIAIIDRNLGSESGLDLIASLRAQLPTLKIVVLSGDDAPNPLPAGVHRWLVKPVPLPTWRVEIATLCAQPLAN